MKVVISILSLNTPEVSKECIDSVIKYTRFESVELWLTDNGSFDNKTADVLKQYEKYPFVKTVYHSCNLGYIGGNNYVFDNTDSEYFVTLNSDTVVCPNWLEILLNEMIEKNWAQVGAWIPNATCSKLNKEGGGCPARSKEDPDYVEGCCMMVNRKAAISVGPTLFSEYLTLAYYEDSDLSLRLRSANYGIGLVELPIKHHQGYTASRKHLIKEDLHGAAIKNREVFRSKWLDFLASPDAKNRILVKRYEGIGDILWTTPILRALNKAHPGATIDFSTHSASSEILNRNPFVNKTVSDFSRIKESDYGRIIDLNMADENNPSTLLLETYAKVANVPLDSYRPEFIPDKQQSELAVKKLGDLIHMPYVVLHVEPPFLWAGRSFPTGKTQMIIDYLTKCKMPVVEVGSTNKSLLSGLAMDIKGKLSISETAEVIKNSKLFIGIYSGPSVMAMAMNVPAIILFGSILPEYRVPKQITNAIPINNSELLCLGCHHYKTNAIGSKGTLSCLRGDVKERCMVEFPVEKIYSAIDSILN